MDKRSGQKKNENFFVQFTPFFRPDSNSTGKIMLFQKKIEFNPTFFVVARTPQTLQKIVEKRHIRQRFSTC